jgi:5,5'-dehydrodivanillate O-demethylase oxygenase subunit
MQLRVPIDDTHTWVCFYTTHAPDGNTQVEDNNQVCIYELPWMRDDGLIRTDYVEGQDIMVWVTQGAITDRSKEHIGKSDVGAIKVRRLFKEQLARVANGNDPMGVVRDPNRGRIDLPCEKNKFGAGGSFAFQWLNMGFSKFSPQLQRLIDLHIDAQKAAG